MSQESSQETSPTDVLVEVRGLEVHFPIKSGIVFDRTVGLEDVPDGYRAMDSRESLKILIRP